MYGPRRWLAFLGFLAVLVGSLGSAPSPVSAAPLTTRVGNIDVDASTIPQLQALMNRNRLTSVRLVQFYQHRISKLEPKLNAIIAMNPRALAEARRADALRRRGDRRPLLGIPVIVKDNINTTGMANTAGSWSLAGSTPSDAFIIERLKAAGAIIFAKANLSEWANFRSIPSSSGWSGIGGQTNNPYVLDRNPCGSSSGSAVVVAASLATVAIGTETDGSIVCPAGATSVVGLKPTLGLVSREGIIPISADQDTAGPMARNVTDAAVVLGAITGIDPADPATAGQAGRAFTSYREFLDADALDGARIGVWEDTIFGINADVDARIEEMLDVMEDLGADITRDVPMELGDFFTPEFIALMCEFKSDLPAYFETYTGAGYPKTLTDVIEFNEAHPELEGPWNSQIFVDSQKTGGRGGDTTGLGEDLPSCDEARETANDLVTSALNPLLADFDAIVATTGNPAWVTDPINGDSFEGFISSSSPAAVAGTATITIPAGYVDGLPVGISFIGGKWDEPALIGYAYALEQATHARVKPQFIPTIGD